MKSFLKYNLPSILWAAFILWLCLVRVNHLPHVTIYQLDKIVHCCFYIVLSLLIFYGWKKQTTFAWPKQNTVAKILLLTISYGFVVEIFQEFLTTDRHFDVLDVLANSTGAVTGSLISVKLFK